MIPVIICFVSILQFLFVMLNLFGLPGNILTLVLPVILYFTDMITGGELIGITAVVLAGEIIEWVSGFFGSKKTGVTNKSVFASILGAIILGVLMAPILFGVGALLGSVIGAFAGTFVYEKMASADNSTALLRSASVMKNRIFAIIIKFALGIAVTIMTGLYIYN